MKRIIRLTESEIKGMIREAINEALNEVGDTDAGKYLLGRVAGRQWKQGRYNDFADTNIYAQQHTDDNDIVGKLQFNKGIKDYSKYSDENQEWGDVFDDGGKATFKKVKGSPEIEKEYAKRHIKNLNNI